MQKIKFNFHERKKPKRIKKIKEGGFIEYILFNPQSFGILSSLSYVFAFLVCFSMLIIGIMFRVTTLIIIFGLLTGLSIYNLYVLENRYSSLPRESL